MYVLGSNIEGIYILVLVDDVSGNYITITVWLHYVIYKEWESN